MRIYSALTAELALALLSLLWALYASIGGVIYLNILRKRGKFSGDIGNFIKDDDLSAQQLQVIMRYLCQNLWISSQYR